MSATFTTTVSPNRSTTTPTTSSTINFYCRHTSVYLQGVVPYPPNSKTRLDRPPPDQTPSPGPDPLERTWDQTESDIIPPRTRKAGGRHPTGMLSCYGNVTSIVQKNILAAEENQCPKKLLFISTASTNKMAVQTFLINNKMSFFVEVLIMK